MTRSPGNFRPLIDAYCDGSASDEQLSELADLLRDNAAARRAFAKAMDLHAALRWRESGGTHTQPQTESDQTTKATGDTEQETVPISAAGVPMYRKGYEPQPFKLRPHHFALIAATLLAACGLAAYLLTASADPKPSSPEPASPPPVATLIQNTGNLRTPHGYPAEGDAYSSGEYTLSSGTAEFMLTNSVNVKLRGETRLNMRNNLNVALTRGSADFVCPTDAKGFTVHLPDGSRIVDLGTAFTVRTDPAGRAWVWVNEGHVQLHTRGRDTHPLFMHEAMLRDEAGVWHRIAPADTRPAMNSLALWLRADRDAVVAQDDRVTRWSPPSTIIDGPPQVAPLDPHRTPRYVDSPESHAVVRFTPDSGPLASPSISLGDSQTVAIVFADRARDTAQRQLVNLNGPPHAVLETFGQPRRIRARLWDGTVRTPSIESNSLTAGLSVAVFRADAETGRIQLWVDGMSVGEQELPFAIAQTSSKVIGGHATNMASGFRGDIAEVLIYDAALSDSDIDALHQTLTERYAKPSAAPHETNETPVPTKETSP